MTTTTTSPRPFARTNYSGYLVENRDAVLAALAAAGHPPLFPRLIAEHVTFAYPDRNTAPAVQQAAIVAVASSDSVQALLVTLDERSARPDGKLFHLTYSLAEGVKPVASNALLAEAVAAGTLSWLPEPISLDVAPF
jgi:hypothetical protein